MEEPEVATGSGLALKIQGDIIWDYIGMILGLYRDNGQENGNYYSVLGLYRDNGKENGSYYIIIGYILGLY